jgi:hypothetical protein
MNQVPPSRVLFHPDTYFLLKENLFSFVQLSLWTAPCRGERFIPFHNFSPVFPAVFVAKCPLCFDATLGTISSSSLPFSFVPFNLISTVLYSVLSSVFVAK